MNDRVPWATYFMRIAYMVAERSTCLRRKVGAVAVRDKRMIATGYNGTPSNIEHCAVVGCIRDINKIPSGHRHELCRGLHAEQNVIIQCAMHGLSLAGSTIYCTTEPCLICAKMLINCNVKEVYFAERYDNDLANEMFDEAGVIHAFLPGDYRSA
jgi:dCMP deaminase